jgi:hypothetical protein
MGLIVSEMFQFFLGLWRADETGSAYTPIWAARAGRRTPPRVQVNLLGCGPTRSGSTFFYSLFFSFFCSFFPDYLN